MPVTHETSQDMIHLLKAIKSAKRAEKKERHRGKGKASHKTRYNDIYLYHVIVKDNNGHELSETVTHHNG